MLLSRLSGPCVAGFCCPSVFWLVSAVFLLPFVSGCFCWCVVLGVVSALACFCCAVCFGSLLCFLSTLSWLRGLGGLDTHFETLLTCLGRVASWCTVACNAYVYSYKIGLQNFTYLGTKTQDVRSQFAIALLLTSRQNSDGVGIQSVERVAQVSPGCGSLMRRIQSAFWDPCSGMWDLLCSFKRLQKVTKIGLPTEACRFVRKYARVSKKRIGGETVLLRWLGNSDRFMLAISRFMLAKTYLKISI